MSRVYDAFIWCAGVICIVSCLFVHDRRSSADAACGGGCDVFECFKTQQNARYVLEYPCAKLWHLDPGNLCAVSGGTFSSHYQDSWGTFCPGTAQYPLSGSEYCNPPESYWTLFHLTCYWGCDCPT